MPVIKRPQRWDQPFSAEMAESDVDRVLAVRPFDSIDRNVFPANTLLRDILLNDSRILRYRRGDIIMRQGDYGSSAFFILAGRARVVKGQGVFKQQLGRAEIRRKGWLGAVRQFRRNRLPEVRDPNRYRLREVVRHDVPNATEVRVFLQDVSSILDKNPTEAVGPGDILGETAALGRTARIATVFAEDEVEALEVRWQGLRDIRRWADNFRQHVDRVYREHSLKQHLMESPLLAHLEPSKIEAVADATSFETYGEFDWFSSYKALSSASFSERLNAEPVIAGEGHYADGLILISAGFARVSKRLNHGHRTLTYLMRGNSFGYDELVHNWCYGEAIPLQRTLRALGYVDVLRAPTKVIEEIVLPELPINLLPKPTKVVMPPWIKESAEPYGFADLREEGISTATLESLVENRFINGTATMVIDMDRCVGCDDCVRACGAAHDNNPRFIRHGPRIGRYMIANACMHCTDPVCMIGCPTGAIHRVPTSGQVVINDDTCIGCATCANSCPYNNIRMVEIRDINGVFIIDENTHRPIAKATKCDLCVDQVVSPACARACPHGAMIRLNMGDVAAVREWFQE